MLGFEAAIDHLDFCLIKSSKVKIAANPIEH